MTVRSIVLGLHIHQSQNTYNLNVGGQSFTVTAKTNSTMGNIDNSDLSTTKNTSFTVESSRGTGMCNITLPNALLGGPYTLTVGGLPPWSHSTTDLSATHTTLYLTYNGTRKYTAMITGTTAIPEFPPSVMLAFLAVSMLALASVFGKRQKLPHTIEERGICRGGPRVICKL